MIIVDKLTDLSVLAPLSFKCFWSIAKTTWAWCNHFPRWNHPFQRQKFKVLKVPRVACEVLSIAVNLKELADKLSLSILKRYSLLAIGNEITLCKEKKELHRWLIWGTYLAVLAPKWVQVTLSTADRCQNRTNKHH